MGAASVALIVPAGTTEGTYHFDCPVCGVTIEKHADRKVVMLLLSAGVEVTEIGESGEPVPGPAEDFSDQPPPLTIDDLIDFHYLLEDEGWFDELARSVG